MKGKSLIGVILAAICVTVTYLLPGSEELSHEGITALGVLGMASILWISNTLPFGVTGLLALVMLVLLGVSDMASVFVGFSNSSVIFVITVFCLTAAVMNTKLTLRLINKLLRWAGSSAEKLVLASDGDKDEFKTALAELSVAVYEKCASLGGDIRGEYGIGYAKTAYLGEAACGEFKAAKAKLDPKGILNPGKVAD